jgi:hypothetical protein
MMMMVMSSRSHFLVSDLVSPLLNGLNILLNNGSLCNGPGWWEGVGGSLGQSKSGMGDGDSSGNRGGNRSSSVASVGGGSDTSVCGGSDTSVCGGSDTSIAGGRVSTSVASVGVSVS